MTRRGDMREVELLDADAPDRDDTVAGRRRHRGRRWLVGSTVVVLLAAGVAQWVTTEREDAAQARLARVPGVLAPVDRTLTVTGRAPTDDAVAFGSLARAADGSQSYSWYPHGRGEAAWTVPLLGPVAALADASEGVVGGTSCQPDRSGSGATTPTRVVCLVTDGAFLMRDSGGVTAVPATRHEVVALTTDAGAVLARWPVDAGDAVAILPRDVVAVGSAGVDGTTVSAYDLLSGAERWSRTELPADYRYAADVPTMVDVFAMGDLVGYTGASGSTTLLTRDGKLVRELSLGAGGGGVSGPGERGSGLTLEQIAGSGRTTTTFVAPDADPAKDVTVDGEQVPLAIDDGSVPDLILTFDSTIKGWDRRTGDQLWSAGVVQPTAAIEVRGRVFVVTGLGVAALDGRSGAVRWESTRDDSPAALMTDGRHVLVAYPGTAGSDAHGVLVAYDPVTGHEDFRTPFPDGFDQLGQNDRQLVALSSATGQYVVLD